MNPGAGHQSRTMWAVRDARLVAVGSMSLLRLTATAPLLAVRSADDRPDAPDYVVARSRPGRRDPLLQPHGHHRSLLSQSGDLGVGDRPNHEELMSTH